MSHMTVSSSPTEKISYEINRNVFDVAISVLK